MTAVRRTVALSADEIGEALHAAKTNETFELSALVLRGGRWRSVLVLFEAEDREDARRQVGSSEILRSRTCRFDARRLRKSSPNKT